MNDDVVSRFSPATREWFTGTFGTPTPAQAGAWNAISQGEHTLVVAPTGSGKTLSAFLWALDRLASAPRPADKTKRCRVLYISPMKALAVDVERNLNSPLVGIKHAATRLGLPDVDIDVAVRSGDTTAKERRGFSSASADVLITTPESLFLILTSAVRENLKGVEYVIIDEIHAVAGTKRGAHLAVSLERLDALLDQPAQRIGLSATVSPVEEVERFLAGGKPVTTVRPPSTKTWDLDVVVPVEDMGDLGSSPTPDYDEHAPTPNASIWPHVEERIVDLVAQHTSTLIFANSRRLAERLTTRLNEIWVERMTVDESQGPGGHPVDTTIAGPASPDEVELVADNPVSEDPDDANPPDGALDASWKTTTEQAFKDPSESVSAAADGPTHELMTAPGRRPPAQMMGNAGQSSGAPAVLARAHHGSVSKDVRAEIESQLKQGTLPAVVATSSLELGIDMGAIDLVIQVESPPSVASGLQRIGRAGHHVGATSHGVLFPKYRSDILSCAVVVERMRTGVIESLAIPSNPLDVLAQHVVAITAMDDVSRADLLALIKRSAPFASLTENVLDSVLDMLAGLYPSESFRELRPRIVWDRTTDQISGRPGAQRLAVTSGGTIPDRGLYGVFLAGGDGPGRRVGELDEEMVYESRVGDVFTLGTSTWRIEDITRDQVLVTPAPGEPARLPFWKGDALGRPRELGEAIGRFSRTLAAASEEDATRIARDIGLDELACRNLITYLTEQQEATGQVPSDKTIIIERFRDEIGDWRVVVHSPFGASVHAPWSLCVAARMREQSGCDVQAMHTDDGIVFRLLDSEGDDEALNAALLEAIILEPDDIAQRVTQEIGSTPLFAARFRECAARALLLPRRNPGQRQALWQQRQRAAALLEVASDFPSFPIVLEAVRECLQDVYDVPGLTQLMKDVAARRIQVVTTQTPTPSPYAKAMLFSYVAQFLYEGDSPLAERRAAALSLDPELLADLLGSASGLAIADLLDPDVIRRFEANSQRLSEERHIRNAEELADALRLLGPLSLDEIIERSAPAQGGDTSATAASWWAELGQARRVIEVRWGSTLRLAAIEDAARLRDALGVALPPGVPAAFLEPSRAPLDDLLVRYAASHGPFNAARAATHFDLGVSVAERALSALARDGRLIQGSLLPDQLGGGDGGAEFCDPNVLRTLRRMSLAALRAEVEPVESQQFCRFLPRWQHVGTKLRGPDALLVALEPLVGIPLPASSIESLVLPTRVAKYRGSDLDELLSAGELIWQGHGKSSRDDGWVSFHLPDTAPLTLARPAADESLDSAALTLLESLQSGGSYLLRDLAGALPHDTSLSDERIADLLWDLVWSGQVTGDTFSPVRALLTGGRATHKARNQAPRSARYARLRGTGLGGGATARTPRMATSLRGPARAAGRWRAITVIDPDPTQRLLTQAELLLARHGIVTRGAVVEEEIPGGFAAIYRVLAEAEQQGLVRRGYFVEGLGASQFAASPAIDALRATRAPQADPWGQTPHEIVVLAACDPANPYGAALTWPAGTEAHAGHRPGRKTGALVVLSDGDLVCYLERGGKTALTWPAADDVWPHVASSLSELITEGHLDSLTLKTIDAQNALTSDHIFVKALCEVGFHAGPQGIRKRR